MKAIIFERHGDPAEVLHVADVPEPQLGFRQVRVRMLAAPINPSDILTIEGRYGRLPNLPATPGFEGVGIVEAAGGGLLARLRNGKRVALINAHGGTWQEKCVVPAKHVVPIPDSVPDEQAAMFFVNPITAVAMVRHILKVPAGSWLLQTAAGSALGHIVIRLGKLYGFKTINVVRRREQAEELRRLGGDVCLSETEESVEERVKQITDGRGVPFVLDPVGGKTGTTAVRCLGLHGRALLYGLLSGESIEADPRLIITYGHRIDGFWLSEWMPRQPIFKMLSVFRLVKKLMSEGTIRADVAKIYSMDQISDAAKHVQAAARGGKVLLQIASK